MESIKKQNLGSFLSINAKENVKCRCQFALFAKRKIVLNDVQYTKTMQ